MKSQSSGGVQAEVEKKQQAERDTSMSIRSEDPLAYTNFGELISIFDANWVDFDDTLRSPKAMRVILGQFNKIRNVVAHSSSLNEDEITRFKLLVKEPVQNPELGRIWQRRDAPTQFCCSLKGSS